MTHSSPFIAFHLVNPSPWPLTGSLAAGGIMFNLISWFQIKTPITMPIMITIISLTVICWWRDIIREASYRGHHTKKVRRGIEWGIVLFIVSEVIFFSAFFWTFFHRRLRPTPELGCAWPPNAIYTLNPFSIPLLNTGVLLSSGATVTWAHHALITNKIPLTTINIVITITLGAYFTSLQVIEYREAMFRFNDSAYGGTFFIATGFHGVHVLVGTLILTAILIRIFIKQISSSHHFGFEAAAWYWHFVDVVWLILFMCIYWWRSP